MCSKDIIEKAINDFNKFIEFIESEKPQLSVKRGVLGKKDSFNLNHVLSYKKDASKPNYTRDQYPIIDLIFSLALAGGLYIKANDKKGKAVLIRTSANKDFKNLNMHEKYIFLLQTYWTKYDFNTKFCHFLNGISIYNIFLYWLMHINLKGL